MLCVRQRLELMHHLFVAHALAVALEAAAVVLGFELTRQQRRYAVAYTVAVSLFALRSLYAIVKTYADHIAHASSWQWDYLCFWLYGRSLAFHLNPYSAHTLTSLALPGPVDAEFRTEILAPGVLYPPWSLPLFRPLGAFADPQAAALLWCAVEVAALLASALIIARFRPDWRPRLPVVAALLFALPPTLATAGFGQTIPLMLLLLALYVARSERVDGGIWLALAVIVKPLVLLVLLVPLLRRRWSTVAAAFATLGVMSLGGMALAGPAVFATYIRENPVARMPGRVLVESTNVPLISYFMRLEHFVPANSATLPPSMIVLSVALIAAGLLVAWLAIEPDATLGFCTLVALSLIVYPQSGSHYATLLILPLLVVHERPEFARRPAAYAAFIAAVYFLLALGNGRFTVLASLTVWAACAFLALAERRARVRQPLERELAPATAATA